MSRLGQIYVRGGSKRWHHCVNWMAVIIQEVKRMIEHERKLYKKLDLGFEDYFDMLYGYETLKFWEFLTRVALNAKFDWEKYTATIKM